MSQPTALHLIDVENLVGGSESTAAEVEAAMVAYWARADRGTADHAVAATGPTLAPAAIFAVGRSRFVIGHGIDGADAALAGWVDDRGWAARRFDRVVIGSGDGYFASLANDLRRRGVEVTVISRRPALSRALAHAASRVVWLDHPVLTTVPQRSPEPNHESPTLTAGRRKAQDPKGTRDADAA